MAWNLVIYSIEGKDKKDQFYGYEIIDSEKYSERIKCIVNKGMKLIETRNDLELEFGEISEKASSLVSRLNRRERFDLRREVKEI